jgi:hypothetical protein
MRSKRRAKFGRILLAVRLPSKIEVVDAGKRLEALL